MEPSTNLVLMSLPFTEFVSFEYITVYQGPKLQGFHCIKPYAIPATLRVLCIFHTVCWHLLLLWQPSEKQNNNKKID